MQVNVYDVTINQFTRSLSALKGVLAKGAAFADRKKIDYSVLLNARLAADMFPLSKQIQIACDGAKFCASRLTGKEAPKFDDKETTYTEFVARIDATLAYLATFKPEDFNGYEKQIARFPWNPGKHLHGHAYLVQHAIPNFYFHLTAAYAILRHLGVEIGKADFLGEQDWHNEKPS